MAEHYQGHDVSQMLKRIDSLIDMWFEEPPPPQQPPSQPLPQPPSKHKKLREHVKHTVNKLLLRAHVALVYSSHEGATQALCYAERALDLAIEHRLPKHRGKAHWFRGEALMVMERWEEAYGAFVSSARVVEGGWRQQGELREKMDRCWEEREALKRNDRLSKSKEKEKSAAESTRRGREPARKAVRFDLGATPR